jgi:hypothetical protein
MDNGRPARYVCASSNEPARGPRHVFAPLRLRSVALVARAMGRRVQADAPRSWRVGEVGDIAQTFLYLMRHGYSSGTIVTVDGGSVLV